MFYTSLNTYILKEYKDSIIKDILLIVVAAANGISILIFTIIYDKIVLEVVKWENHKYESEMENSLLLKSFAFNFGVSYINLFYYAFFGGNRAEKTEAFGILSTNFITVVISKNLAFIFVNNLLPYMIYIYRKRVYLKIWPKRRTEMKLQFVN